jgi:hypothetical protein
MNALLTNLLSLKKVFGCARDESSTATLHRLSESRHVSDLRVIFAATCYLVVFICLFLLVIGEWLSAGSLLVVGGGVIAWAYQTGSARLGIVDLFACEISTLCRVCTITDMTRRHINSFNLYLPKITACDPTAIKRMRDAFARYDPGENYSPVFDQHVAELRVLDVGVVTDVTAFYTYLKAMKDNLRSLAKINSFEAIGQENDSWHEALKNVIYMEFLAFESARKAICALVEYEPKRSENALTILISEVRAYHFLLNHFDSGKGNSKDEDFRHARLELRRDSYREIVSATYNRVHQAIAHFDEAPHPLTEKDEAAQRAWEKCVPTAQELKDCYTGLFDEELEPPKAAPGPMKAAPSRNSGFPYGPLSPSSH